MARMGAPDPFSMASLACPQGHVILVSTTLRRRLDDPLPLAVPSGFSILFTLFFSNEGLV